MSQLPCYHSSLKNHSGLKSKTIYIVSLSKLFNLLKTTLLTRVSTEESYRYGVYSYACIYQINIKDFVVETQHGDFYLLFSISLKKSNKQQN